MKKTIRVELDGELFEEMERIARETGLSRSALVRDALRDHLRRFELQRMEERDRAGYAAIPPATGESFAWEAAAAWPEE